MLLKTVSNSKKQTLPCKAFIQTHLTESVSAFRLHWGPHGTDANGTDIFSWNFTKKCKLITWHGETSSLIFAPSARASFVLFLFHIW